MKESTPSSVETVGLFVGIYSMTTVRALTLVWGNLSTYTKSYFYFRLPEDEDLDLSWVIASITVSWSIGMMVCAKITDAIGLRKSMAAGSLIFNVSLFLCFIVVQRSFLALILVFGLTCGFFIGFTQGQQLQLVTMWCNPRFLGLGYSVVYCSQQLGAVVMNTVATWYINPNNLIPDTLTLNAKLFSQPEILDKVPNVFIVYGAISSIFSIVSFVLVKEKPQRDCRCVDRENVCEISMDSSKNNSEHPITNEDVSGNSINIPYRNIKKQVPTSSVIAECSRPQLLETTQLKQDHGAKKKQDEISTTKEHKREGEFSDQSPKQALKTTAFYALLVLALQSDITFVILNSYYKLFGMLYYPEDHFFTQTSMALNGGSCVILGIAGILSDKFKVKNVIIASCCIVCLVSASFKLAIQVNKWLYSICVVVCAGVVNGNYFLTSIGITRYFGRTHSTTIYGMAMSVSLVTNGITPPILHYVVSTFGWLAIYTSVSVINLIGIIVIVTGLPVINNTTG